MKCLILLSLLAGITQAASCPDVTAEQLGVEYVNQQGFGQVSWRVWRQPNRIAYEYPDKGIIEVWQLNQQQIEFMRIFTQEQRGIYYSHSDLLSINQQPDWQQVNQMLTPTQRQGLGDPNKQQDTCFKYLSYQQADQVNLTWNQDLNLPVFIANRDKKQRTQQQQIYSSNQSHAFFAQLDQYSLLDFSDIGDSESDPFVRKMIKLGYVDHGNSSHYPNAGHSH